MCRGPVITCPNTMHFVAYGPCAQWVPRIFREENYWEKAWIVSEGEVNKTGCHCPGGCHVCRISCGAHTSHPAAGRGPGPHRFFPTPRLRGRVAAERSVGVRVRGHRRESEAWFQNSSFPLACALTTPLPFAFQRLWTTDTVRISRWSPT